MIQLRQVQSDDRELNQAQNNIIDVLNPILRNNPDLFGVLLKSIQLKAGANVIGTGLGKPVEGWYIVRKRSAADIYDQQDSSNSAIFGTLTLNASDDVNVDIIVY
jgi:hypothetical protein